MARIKGPSGVVVEAPDSVASGLVSGGHAEYVDAPDQPKDDGKPSGNASRAEWEAYALDNGKTADDLDGLKRDQIKALFEQPAEDESDESKDDADDESSEDDASSE